MNPDSHGLPNRLYARLGWKVWPTVAAGSWGMTTVLIIIETINAVRLRPAPPGALLELCLWALAVGFVTALALGLVTVRMCAPLRRPLRSQADLVDAWQTAVALPLRLTVTGAIIGSVWTSPALLVSWVRIYGLDAASVVFFVINALVATTAATSLFIYLSPVLLRPLLADLQARLDRVPTTQTVTFRARFALLVPALSLGTTAAGAVLAQRNSSGIDAETNIAVIVSTCLALVIWTPVVLMFARSMLSPLADLLAATERIKTGDYTQPVPGAWADELGAVAGSLNDAMRGLAERQQMARDVRESRARIVAAGGRVASAYRAQHPRRRPAATRRTRPRHSNARSRGADHDRRRTRGRASATRRLRQRRARGTTRSGPWTPPRSADD